MHTRLDRAMTVIQDESIDEGAALMLLAWLAGLILPACGAQGAAGLPVFSPHGPGGIAQLLGPTGGYLLSYPFAAALTSLLYRRGRRSFLTALAAAGLGSIVILAAGATWLGLLTHSKFSVVFAQSVAPFLTGDAVKILAATACVSILGSFGNDSRDRVL